MRLSIRLRLIGILTYGLGVPSVVMGADDGLIGHWKLAGDCQDYSGRQLHGVNHGVQLTNEGARFDGKGYVEVLDGERLGLGADSFTVSLWLQSDEDIDDPGDILGQYDPKRRKGFQLTMTNGQYRTSANRRNLFFGIDDGRMGVWQDCGKCDNVGVWCLAVHKGKLYAGSYTRNNGSRTDLNPPGHVYRYEGGTRWNDLGRLGQCSNVLCLASCAGELYAGVSYDEGSNGPAGKVYRYDQDSNQWIDCGRVGACQRVECMAVYQNRLYAGTQGGDPASVYRYEGGQKWTAVETKMGGTASLGVCRGKLHTWTSGVFEYDGNDAWTRLGRPGGKANYQIWSLTAYRGELLAGTFPSGHVYACDGSEEWMDRGRLQTTYQDNAEKEVMALIVYNGKLYGSAWPTGEVYRYDDNSVAWTYLATLGRQGFGSAIQFTRTSDQHGRGTGNVIWASNRDDEKPPVVRNYAGSPGISRTPCLAVYQGKLFAGTWNWEYDLPGHIYSTEAGKCVSHDHVFPGGWKHLTVVKANDRLTLYIDGEVVATSAAFDPKDYDLNSDRPLTIGFVCGDYFKGRMKDVRIYKRGLSPAEIAALAEETTKN